MARQIKNILVGVGTVSATAASKTFNAATPGAYTDLGFTMDGVEITLEPDFVDITVDQLGDAAKLVEQSAKIMLRTTLAEATLENLALAWGYETSNIVTAAGTTKTLNLGVFEDGRASERSIKFVGKSPDGLARTYTCRRVVSISSSGHSYKRGEATVFPVEFRLLPDSSSTGSEYGTIVDTLPAV